jgi:hypothetical protein
MIINLLKERVVGYQKNKLIKFKTCKRFY